MNTALSIAKDSALKSRDDVRILTGFTIAHGIFHFMHQSFAVMLPAIKEAFGISPIQIGALMTAKEFAMAEISRRFSDRKGAALAIFGIGGSFGDIFILGCCGR